MGVNAVLVLDEVRDVDQVIGELTANSNVLSVEQDSYYHPDAVKADRVYVTTFSRYWYPNGIYSHRSPGNWVAVSAVCQVVWALDPNIVVHYIPEPDWIGDVTAAEVIENGHRLTPASVAELDVLTTGLRCRHE